LPTTINRDDVQVKISIDIENLKADYVWKSFEQSLAKAWAIRKLIQIIEFDYSSKTALRPDLILIFYD
jgi:hypothetical protein